MAQWSSKEEQLLLKMSDALLSKPDTYAPWRHLATVRTEAVPGAWYQLRSPVPKLVIFDTSEVQREAGEATNPREAL